MVFAEALTLLEQYGNLTDVILPFLLIFTIVFAVMEKVEILGTSKKNHTVVALILSLLVVIPHITGRGPDVVPIINSVLPSASLVLVGVVCFLLLIGIFGGRGTWAGNRISGAIAVIAFLIVLYIFGLSVGYFQGDNILTKALSNPEIQAVVVIIIVFALIIGFIVGDTREKKRESELLTEIGGHFK